MIGWVALSVLLVVGGALVYKEHLRRQHFVSISTGHFSVQGERFFPLVLNYTISLYSERDSMWAAPYYEYNQTTPYTFSYTKDSLDLRANLELVREMGFNTVRLVGLAEASVRNDSLLVIARDRDGWDRDFLLMTQRRREQLIAAVRSVLNAVERAGLKAIVLVRIRPDDQRTEDLFVELAEANRDDPTILAWDLFNEPLYFDPKWRDKSEVRSICDRWRELMRDHAPDQLFTIGLTGMRETFEWDPAVLDVDFLSFHPYEYEPEQVRNEIRWYGEHVRKPWIIGETSLPADNDSVPYGDQATFARRTVEQVVACGGVGYSWWQYKDVDWKRFHSDYMGLLNRTGSTRTATNGYVVAGTRKPAVDVFKALDPWAMKAPRAELPNYFNYGGHTAYRLTGTAVDEQNAPLDDAVIMAWNEDWTRSYHAPSDAQGHFILGSDFKPFHWVISAPACMRVQGERGVTVADQAASGDSITDLGVVPLQPAELGK
jgi:Cellulase (glycosyl hydrolase family 5)